MSFFLLLGKKGTGGEGSSNSFRLPMDAIWKLRLVFLKRDQSHMEILLRTILFISGLSHRDNIATLLGMAWHGLACRAVSWRDVA